MNLDPDYILDIIEYLEGFLARNRPPENLRDKLDISYSIENQSVRIFEVRPKWNNPEEKSEHDCAKATYIKSRKVWQVYRRRADSKWHIYKPKKEVRTIKEFVQLVEEDKMHCFWG